MGSGIALADFCQMSECDALMKSFAAGPLTMSWIGSLCFSKSLADALMKVKFVEEVRGFALIAALFFPPRVGRAAVLEYYVLETFADLRDGFWMLCLFRADGEMADGGN